MSYSLVSTLWTMVKDTDSFRAFTLIMLTVIAVALATAFDTLSAQNQIIDAKIEVVKDNSINRSEWAQVEKRLEAIQGDIREIRNKKTKD